MSRTVELIVLDAIGDVWCAPRIETEERLRKAAEACHEALADVYGVDRICLRVRTVAEAMDCPADTVRLWIRTGKLPRVRIGRSLFVKREDLLTFVEEHRRAS